VPTAAGDATNIAAVEVFRAIDGDEGYAYLTLAADAASPPACVAAVRAAWPGATIAFLAPLLDIAGAARGRAAPFHYVVETDVLPDREDDFNAWYDEEHMPGLARVEGTVRARRFRNPDGHPRYHACYDLVVPETLGSPPWLAVRGTAWSSRVRPTFVNTRRTMFRRTA
jgi:hypothetical protein